MKHHNLYRLTLLGYWGGGTLLTLMFLCATLGIITGNDAAEGLAYFFCLIGVALTIGGGVAHVAAIDSHKELKPLPKGERDDIERQARNRLADRTLRLALEEADDQTRAIEGRVKDPDVWPRRSDDKWL